jgi:pSer/pThr/pTyr-binding forkhead associated (FHA) protein
MARLRVVTGPLAGQTIEVDKEVVIGRHDTDLMIDDAELSRRHVVVRRFANRLQVEDLDSSNGTFVDGNRIKEPTLIGGGAEIKIGITVLVVEGVLPVRDSEAREVVDLDRNKTRLHDGPAEVAGTNAREEIPVGAASTATASPAAAGGGTLAQPAASPGGPSASPAAPLVGAPSGPVGEFRPPTKRQQRGLASRSWIPVALSFGTVILTAIALVIYFSAHS